MGFFGKVWSKVKGVGKKLGPKYLLSKAKDLALGFVPGGGLINSGIKWLGNKGSDFAKSELGGKIATELRKDKNDSNGSNQGNSSPITNRMGKTKVRIRN